MLENRNERALADLAVLAEPTRRNLYLHVVAQREPVSRDAAAAAVGIGRPLAAFHLDRLVEAGLLSQEFRRLSGRSGPGAGRPAKLYRASDREVRASVPERRYEVAAQLFADALSGGSEGLAASARDYGTVMGAEARRRAGTRAGTRRRLAALESVLRDAGYAPVLRDGLLRLRNCPFHELAERHRELTCGMNLSLLQGLLDGARLDEEAASFDPVPGMCCVAIATEGAG